MLKHTILSMILILLVLFFALHEMPRFARQNLIKRTQEYTKKEIVFVDISTDYNPSPHMLIGEPYIKEYLKNIDEDLKNFEKISIIDGHVSMWSMKLSVFLFKYFIMDSSDISRS